mgnify:CR=1 FL=1
MDTAPLNVSDTHVTIGLDPEFAAEKGSLENQRTLLFIQKTLADFLKRSVSVNFDVLTGKAEPKTAIPKNLDKKQYYENQAVRSVLETFSGDIETVRK